MDRLLSLTEDWVTYLEVGVTMEEFSPLSLSHHVMLFIILSNNKKALIGCDPQS